MRIFRIAQMIDATAPNEERLKEAVRKVLDGKSITDAAEIYGVATEELSKEVSDARRLQSLPVKEIMAIRNRIGKPRPNGKPEGPPSANLIALMLKLQPTDVAWVLRKVDTQRKSKVPKEDVEKILKLHDAGLSSKQIAYDLDIEQQTVASLIKRNRGPQKPAGTDVRAVSNQAYNDFLSFYEPELDIKKSIEKVLSKYPVLSREQMIRILNYKGFRAARKQTPFSFGEYLKAKQLMSENPDLTLRELAKVLGRTDPTPLSNFLKKTDPKWHAEHISNKIPSHVVKYIRDLAIQKGITSTPSIAKIVNERFNSSYSAFGILSLLQRYEPEWYEKNLKRKTISDSDKDRIVEMAAHGWPIEYIVDMVNSELKPVVPVSDQTVKNLMREKGIQQEPYGNTGRGLIYPFWDDVVDAYRSGKTITQLAKQFGGYSEQFRKILHLKGVRNAPEMENDGYQFGSMAAPYAGKILQETGQKEAYLKWRLSKIENKSEQKNKLDAYDAFGLDFEPGSVTPDAPTPDVNELFRQVGLPPLQPKETPPTKTPEVIEMLQDPPAYKTISREEYERRRKNFVTNDQFREMIKERESVSTFNLKQWIRIRA